MASPGHCHVHLGKDTSTISCNNWAGRLAVGPRIAWPTQLSSIISTCKAPSRRKMTSVLCQKPANKKWCWNLLGPPLYTLGLLSSFFSIIFYFLDSFFNLERNKNIYMCLFLPKCSTADTEIKPQGRHPLYTLWMYRPHFLALGMFVLAASRTGIFKLIFRLVRKSVSSWKWFSAKL